MPDCTTTAIKLLRPVKNCLGKCHSRRSKPDQGCARPVGHVCEVNIGKVKRGLHHIEKGCVRENQGGQNELGKGSHCALVNPLFSLRAFKPYTYPMMYDSV